MAVRNDRLIYRKAWLVVGYFLVVFVIYSSLTSHTVKVDIADADKYAHTFAYFVLMGWFAQLYHSRQSVIVCVACFIAMGVGLEFMQGMTAYRSFDYFDMLANTLGVLIAWGLTLTRFPQLLSYLELKLNNKIKVKPER